MNKDITEQLLKLVSDIKVFTMVNEKTLTLQDYIPIQRAVIELESLLL